MIYVIEYSGFSNCGRILVHSPAEFSNRMRLFRENGFTTKWRIMRKNGDFIV